MKTKKPDNIEKLLLQSRVSNMYKKFDDAKLTVNIINHLHQLCSENDLSDKNMYAHQTRSIYPSIAIYKECIKYGMDRDIVYNSIKNTAFTAVQSSASFLQKFSKLPFFFSLFGKMCKVGTSTIFGKDGFEMIWEGNTKTEIKWTCKSCFYKNEFTKYAVPELTTIFCEVDDIIYGNLSNVKWARTKTIGGGDGLCDFHFIKKNN